MIHRVSFSNHNGGGGKSTSATNTAFDITQVLRRANASNPRVLIIDTDSQSHAAFMTPLSPSLEF